MKLIIHIIRIVLFSILMLPIILTMLLMMWTMPDMTFEKESIIELIRDSYRYKCK